MISKTLIWCCFRHGESTIFLSGVHAVPVLEPTSVIFQQAADVGMSHSALLRHVLSRACVRAGLPPTPPPLAQDVTETSLVCPLLSAIFICPGLHVWHSKLLMCCMPVMFAVCLTKMFVIISVDRSLLYSHLHCGCGIVGGSAHKKGYRSSCIDGHYVQILIKRALS